MRGIYYSHGETLANCLVEAGPRIGKWKSGVLTQPPAPTQQTGIHLKCNDDPSHGGLCMTMKKYVLEAVGWDLGHGICGLFPALPLILG